jgi:hypothetical protein
MATWVNGWNRQDLETDLFVVGNRRDHVHQEVQYVGVRIFFTQRKEHKWRECNGARAGAVP